jgi:hypothetical protein
MIQTHRNRFVQNLFHEISHLRYAALRFVRPLDEFNENELKILLDRRHYKQFLEIISNSENIISVSLVEKPFSTTLHLNFYDHSKLELNVVSELVRKGIKFMDAKQILSMVLVEKDGVKIPQPSYSFEYVVLSHILNGANVAEEYRDYFRKFSRDERSKIFAHIRSKYFVVINVLDDLYSFDEKTYNQLRSKILKREQNGSLRTFFRSLLYIPWYFINIYHRKNFKITFKRSSSQSDLNQAHSAA